MMDMAIEYMHAAKTVYNICCGGVANCYAYVRILPTKKWSAKLFSVFGFSVSWIPFFKKFFFSLLKKSMQLSQAKI